MSNPSTVYGFLTDLLSQGIPLPANASQLTLQLVDELPDRNLKYDTPVPLNLEPAGNTRQKRYEASEHIFMGDSIQLQTGPNTTISGADFRLNVGTPPAGKSTQVGLSYGQIVALAGDFYGVPGSPICKGGVTAFQNAFDSLHFCNGDELVNILAVMQIEIDELNKGIVAGISPDDVFKTVLGSSLLAKWNIITGGGPKNVDWKSIPLGLPPEEATLVYCIPGGRFVQLASNNLDHFGKSALFSYLIGHQMAITVAAKGGNIYNLYLAYGMNAFADHFLSDLFAAGHLRTPRELLQETISDHFLDKVVDAMAKDPQLMAKITALQGPNAIKNTKEYLDKYQTGVIGTILSKFMHDEDNQWGLNVTNGNGDKWRAYGDTMFLDAANAINAGIAKQALTASAADIFQAWASSTNYPMYTALSFIPQLSAFDKTEKEKTALNFSPMFVYDGKLKQRAELLDKSKFSWNCNFVGASSLKTFSLAASNDPFFAPPTTGNYPFPPAADYVPQIDIALSPSEFPGGKASYPKNWVGGNTVRYAVAFQYETQSVSNLSQWMPWYTIDLNYIPAVILPSMQIPNQGNYPILSWVIYRQFTVKGIVQPMEGPFILQSGGLQPNTQGRYDFYDTNP